nr:MAG TPA: hypothetical protein [Caudoviricetes sp.]
MDRKFLNRLHRLLQHRELEHRGLEQIFFQYWLF